MKLNISLVAIISVMMASSTCVADQRSEFDDEEKTQFDFSKPVSRLLANTCSDQFYFKTSIVMSDSYVNNPLTCSSTQLQAIGAEINKIYDEAMMLDAALATTILLDTAVCPKASTSGRRSLRVEKLDTQRELIGKLYIWSGKGSCKLCPPDNADRRMMLSGKYRSARELQTSYTYKYVNFSTDSAGNKLTVRNYIKYEWRNKYGMTVTVKNTMGFAPEGRARIFNTANVTGGAWSLGSPNQNCNPSGPGQGSGGAPGQPGENCKAQGNVLIIQETEQWDPGMWKQSGDFVFTFDSPTRIGYIGLMDMTDNRDNIFGWILWKDVYGTLSRIDFKGLGTNSVQSVKVDKVVKEITVVLKAGGAVRNIAIYTPTTAAEAMSAEARLFLQNHNFVQYIPQLEFDLSYFLTRRINAKFGRDISSCLFDKWADISVQVNQVSSPASLTC